MIIACPTEDLNIESWVGKVLMGAFASPLVFIAIIIFTKVLLTFLTDTIKIFLIFASSFALTATGYIYSQKKNRKILSSKHFLPADLPVFTCP